MAQHLIQELRECAASYDYLWADENMVKPTALLECAAAEIERLRQGLWDCARASGIDQDEVRSPEALVEPDIVSYAVEAVRDLMEAYYQCLKEL